MEQITIILLALIGAMFVGPIIMAVGLSFKASLSESKRLVRTSKARVERAKLLTERTYLRIIARQNSTEKWESEALARETAARKAITAMKPIRVLTADEAVSRMEQHVEERERRIKERAPSPLSPETEAKIDAFVVWVEAALHQSLGWMHHLKSMLGVADRNIDRAYSRLCRQVSDAHEASVVAELHYEGIELQRGAYTLQLLQPDDQSFAELERTVSALRLRNFFVGDALFRIDRLVRRLYVVKQLLLALPRSAREEVAQFRNAVKAVSGYIQQVASTDEEPTAAELYARVDSLENRVLMVYLRNAKEKSSLKSGQHRISKRIRETRHVIEGQIAEESKLLNDWTERALGAKIEGKKLVESVSELRAEQCEVVLRSLERTTKVLTAVEEALGAQAVTMRSDTAG